MASISQRLERGFKTTSLRTLRFNMRAKRLFTRRGSCLFVTCFPKSGSTFLVSVLEEATGYMRQFLGYNHLNEQDLYLPSLIDSYNMNIVCHQHTRATRPNLALMREFSIRPIVLVRNVFDCIVSLRDHLEKESRTTPIFNASDAFFAKSTTAQCDELIDLALPWYVNFITSWINAEQQGVDLLWTTYEDLITNKPEVIRRILEFYNLDQHANEIVDAVSRIDQDSGTRFNKGVSGRGERQLTPEQQKRIVDRFSHAGTTDLSLIGISSAQLSAASRK